MNLNCRPLDSLDPADLGCVRKGFETAMACATQQAWLPATEADFAPASVRTGWREDALWVLADLTDQDIFTHATAPNQRCWELGDAFEIFLRPEAAEAYVELQVTPNNHRLQLRYAHRAALDRARASGDMNEALLPAESFGAWTWVEPGRWTVLARIPAALVCGAPSPLAGRRWRFSFSRYDYTRGRAEPVISSTSPHPQADFHRQVDWGFLIFAAR